MAQSNAVVHASNYPENLGQHKFWNCCLSDYRRRLDGYSEELFGDDVTARLEYYQLDTNTSTSLESQRKVSRTADGLVQQLNVYSAAARRAPKCAYYFIRAPNSKKKLEITGNMARVLFSHHEVTPMFLDFLFPFRQQKHKKNFDFSGFRSAESWIDRPMNLGTNAQAGLPYTLQLCYNLRCIESTPRPPEWPWSMRQTAVYHSFNLRNGDAIWINIKGNTDISPRVVRILGQNAPSDPADITDSPSSLRAALATHLVYCEWASENWASYVGFLEDRLHDKTRFALLADVASPKRQEPEISKVDRTQTEPTPVARRSTMASIMSAGRKPLSKFMSVRSVKFSVKHTPIAEENELRLQPATNDGELEKDFTYDDLRAIQYIEDQANGTLLAIRSNISIIGELSGYYNRLRLSKEFHSVTGTGCDPVIKRFVARFTSILNDMKLHQARLETLLQLLADRKSLLLQLFAHRNMTANKEMTHRALEQAEKMENLTTHMKQIALKTEKETIFMRIITVVTLFFLPGTFVAVSGPYFSQAMAALIPQTLMSTDVVKFQNDNSLIHRFSWQALVMYVGITIPIMALTVLVAFWYRNREQERLKREREESGKLDLELGLKSGT